MSGSDRQDQDPTATLPASDTPSAKPAAPIPVLTWARRMDEIERLGRRRLWIKCGVSLVVLAGTAALFAVAWSPPAKPTPVFDFRGIEMRSPPQADMVPVAQDAHPELSCYERADEEPLLLDLPIDNARYFFDDNEHRLRRIEIHLSNLELGMKAAEEIDHALATKFGEHFTAGDIKSRFREGAKELTQTKNVSMPALGVRIHLGQNCLASQREGSGVYDMTPTSACTGTLTFVDTTWDTTPPPEPSTSGL